MIFMLLMNLIVLSFRIIALGLEYALTCEERKARGEMIHVDEYYIYAANECNVFPFPIYRSKPKVCFAL